MFSCLFYCHWLFLGHALSVDSVTALQSELVVLRDNVHRYVHTYKLKLRTICTCLNVCTIVIHLHHKESIETVYVLKSGSQYDAMQPLWRQGGWVHTFNTRIDVNSNFYPCVKLTCVLCQYCKPAFSVRLNAQYTLVSYSLQSYWSLGE